MILSVICLNLVNVHPRIENTLPHKNIHSEQSEGQLLLKIIFTPLFLLLCFVSRMEQTKNPQRTETKPKKKKQKPNKNAELCAPTD